LTLADAPNPNGWDLQPADILEGDFLAHNSRAANIILANPTFRNFSSREQGLTNADSTRTAHVSKAAEVLHRIVTNMQAGSVFGVVLPRGLLSSRNAEPLRQFLATNFELSEICLLPDKVFTSDAESVVILGRRLLPGQQNRSTILYRRVRESGIENFKRSYEATSDSYVQVSRFSKADEWNFFVPDLEEVWEFCQALPKFGSIADIGQGLQFRSRSDPAFPE
jgi:type I restriction-modification system DNA methylase subunit